MRPEVRPVERPRQGQARRCDVGRQETEAGGQTRGALREKSRPVRQLRVRHDRRRLPRERHERQRQVALFNLLAIETEGVLVERDCVPQVEGEGGRRAAQAPAQQRGPAGHPARLPAAAAALLEQPHVAAAQIQVDATEPAGRAEGGRHGEGDRGVRACRPGEGEGVRRGREVARQSVPDVRRPGADQRVPVGTSAPRQPDAQGLLEGGAAGGLQIARHQRENLRAAPLPRQRIGGVAGIARPPQIE